RGGPRPGSWWSRRTRSAWQQSSRPPRLGRAVFILLVVLHLARRAGRRAVGVVARPAPGAPLPQQVPALVERRLQLLDAGVLLVGGQPARLQPGAQAGPLIGQCTDPAQ